MADTPRANFIIELAALPNGMYRITARAPRGVITVDAPNPFTDEAITELLDTLSRPHPRTFQKGVTLARDFGARMFEFLFTKQIYAAYVTTLAETGENVRFRLSVERAGALAGLPWELIRDPDRDHLALASGTPIVRTLNQFVVRPPVVMPTPIRVLVMIASPTEIDGRPIAKLDVEGEWTRLQEAVAPLQDRVELVRLDRATPKALQTRLRQEAFHVFHFIGHSEYDELTQQGLLLVEDEKDVAKGVRIPAASLGLELGGERTIRLVVMNSCHSGRMNERDALTSIVGNLAVRGIGAVVAMQFAITDGSAKNFSEEFYRALADFYPIDAAVSEGRRAILRRNNAEWATPVLYLRADDEGVLFMRPAADTVVLPKAPVDLPIEMIPTPLPAPPPVDLPIEPVRDPPPISTSPNTPLIRIGAVIVVGVLALALILAALTGQPQIDPTPTPLPPTPIVPTLTVIPDVTLTPTRDPAALPDLRIGTVRVSPARPAPGEGFRVSIPITNVGNADSGAFAWAWDASVRPPLSLNTQTGTVENIPPGATRTVSVRFVYGWWGTYSAQIKIDVDSQVAESDERDNNLPFDITLSDNPFEIDFTLFPDNEIVQPPLLLPDGAFDGWGLDIGVNTAGRTDCDAAALRVDDAADGFVALSMQPAPELPPDCAMLPLQFVVTRRVVANAMLEVRTPDDGSVTMILYADSAGTRAINSFRVSTAAGEIAAVGVNDGVIRNVRRIDVRADGQAVAVTRLILFSPSAEMN
jgi:hypothetical protein